MIVTDRVRFSALAGGKWEKIAFRHGLTLDRSAAGVYNKVSYRFRAEAGA